MLIQFIDRNHECADCRIERECLDVCPDLQYKLVQGLEFVRGRLVIIDNEVVPVIEKPPDSLQKSEHPVDTFCVPWFRLFQWTEKHLVKSQCVSPVGIAYHIRVHDIVHGLAHLLHSIAANIFPVFKNELRIREFRSPLAECIQIEPVIMDNIDIHMYFGSLVLVLESA